MPYLSNIGKKDDLFIALLFRAMSVCVNECCSIGFACNIRFARAVFANAIDARGGDGVAEVIHGGLNIPSSAVGFGDVTLDDCDALSSGTDPDTRLSIVWDFVNLFVSLVSLLSNVSPCSSSLLVVARVSGFSTVNVLFTTSFLSLASSFVFESTLAWTLSVFVLRFSGTSWLIRPSWCSAEFWSSTSGQESDSSPHTSGFSASFSDLTSSVSPPSFDDGGRCWNLSLFLHFALRFWNQTCRRLK